jgi:thioredoxin reductase (NADPH)
MTVDEAQVGIVGAGPIGIELHVALKKAGFRVLHFDAKQIGYTISWFAPQTRFFSSNERIGIAGVPLQTIDQGKATREDYLAYLRGVVQQFDLDIRTYEKVIDIRRHPADCRFHLTTDYLGLRRTCVVEKLVLATGGTDHPRRLNIPGEDLPHVSHYFQDPHTYFRKRLLIVGGRNSAAEAALRCHHARANVSISYRREQLDPKSIKYWLLPEINGYISSGRMGGHFQTTPVAITPTHVTLKRSDGQTFDVPADFVLLLIGYESDMTLCQLAGVELVGPCLIPRFDPATMETNVPGLYVAGTATGGTQQKFTVFIENCHMHVDRIVASLRHTPAPPPQPDYAQQES